LATYHLIGGLHPVASQLLVWLKLDDGGQADVSVTHLPADGEQAVPAFSMRPARGWRQIVEANRGQAKAASDRVEVVRQVAQATRPPWAGKGRLTNQVGCPCTLRGMPRAR
jgi:hypothetical protein